MEEQTRHLRKENKHKKMKKKINFGKKEYSEINSLLNSKFNEKTPLIAVHRGTASGTIVENTILSQVASLQAGGDMIEVDVVKSTDGKYYAFHDGNEYRLLKKRKNIKEMSSREIESLTYYCPIGESIEYKVEKLDDILEYFKGKDVLINIDRAWNYFEELLKYFDKYEMEKQLVFKSAPKKEFLDVFSKHPVKYMYMPIVSKKEEVDATIRQKDLNLVGFELLAENEDDTFFDKKYLKGLKEKGYFCWINAIRLNDVRKLYAGYDDNISITEGGDKGWGVLIERGADIIQTDWPFLLEKYLKSK